ncbi:hypothetical protein I6M48_18140 [Shewanella algae]|uniref:hypothetical protein n=1 Tax=Shewanella algae TaxID=38313 RepID=UPI001AAE549C|nr:hypothetical protein [Shewanella algae]MBO2634392.1 hypothetical protein [Shewanella algae]
MDKFFSPIKNKVHIIELLMNSIKYMLINPEVSKGNSKGKIVLKIDKMSRIFYVKSDKIFSIAFPFNVIFEDAYFFKYKNEMDINSMVASKVISLINEPSFLSGCSIEFAEPISEYQERYNCDRYWDFVRELLVMEDGYLRYDYDIDNYERHKRSDKHPLNHFDLFYTSNATFKIGLRRKINESDFVDMLDIKTKCHFLAN